MPYTTEWTSRGVIWTYNGLLTGEELLRSNLEIYGDPRFDDLAYEIVDLSGVEEFDVDELSMRKVAHLDMAASRTNPRIRVAIVAALDAAVRITELYGKFASNSPWPMQRFETRAEAESWVASHLTPSPFRLGARFDAG